MSSRNGIEREESIENEFNEDGNPESARIEEFEQKIAEAQDQLLRRTAEMENMRRRHQQEREQLIFEANRRLLTDLLGTVDDLERTLEHAAKENDPMTQGIELVYRNFLKILERYGVRPMDAVDLPFDPHMHDAMMEEPRSDVKAGTVVRVIQKGYILKENVLRHAKVIVAKESE